MIECSSFSFPALTFCECVKCFCKVTLVSCHCILEAAIRICHSVILHKYDTIRLYIINSMAYQPAHKVPLGGDRGKKGTRIGHLTSTSTSTSTSTQYTATIPSYFHLFAPFRSYSYRPHPAPATHRQGTPPPPLPLQVELRFSGFGYCRRLSDPRAGDLQCCGRRRRRRPRGTGAGTPSPRTSL